MTKRRLMVCCWGGLLMGVVMSSVWAAPLNVRTDVPSQAPQYLPMLKAEIERAMPEHSQPSYFGALVEQESCISLSHRRCWNPTSQLKTAREEGAGFGQITRAYAHGRLRFDALAENKLKVAGLSELNWGNVYRRPDLQLRLMVGMIKGCELKLQALVPAASARHQMCDAAYNGGLAGLLNERRACHLSQGCDADLWFNHIERHCLKSRRVLYGQRSACDINREHVRTVFIMRRKKYIKFLGEDKP